MAEPPAMEPAPPAMTAPTILLVDDHPLFASAVADIVASLYVDDGVADRGHRTNLVNEKFIVLGASCGPHKVFDVGCTID